MSDPEAVPWPVDKYRHLIEEVLRHTGGNQSRAAKILGMTRNTLRERIRRYGLERPGKQASGRTVTT